LSLHLIGLAQHFQQALGDELGAGVQCGALDEDDELIAAEARCGVARANDSFQAGRDGP
jgi:hypothetical protein